MMRYSHGRNASIQRAALASWSALSLAPNSKPQLVLLGDEYGVSELAQEFGATQIKNVKQNKWGTPELYDTVHPGILAARGDLIAFVSSDVELGPSFVEALRICCEAIPGPFLLTGKTRDSDPSSTKPRYFAFRRSNRDLFPLAERPPPVAWGRPGAENWFIVEAIIRGIPVVDGSDFVEAIHPYHDTRHTRWGTRERLLSSHEAKENRTFGGELFLCDNWLKHADAEILRTGAIRQKKAEADRKEILSNAQRVKGETRLLISQKIIDQALLLEKEGFADQAIKFIYDARAGGTTCPELIVVEALCLRTLGRFAEARTVLQRAFGVPGLREQAEQVLALVNQEEAAQRGVANS